MTDAPQGLIETLNGSPHFIHLDFQENYVAWDGMDIFLR